MSNREPNTFVYLLIDNGMLAEVSTSYTEDAPGSRPAWLAPIYPERALAVSPLLVDLEAAYESGDLDRVMHFVNARSLPCTCLSSSQRWISASLLTT